MIYLHFIFQVNSGIGAWKGDLVHLYYQTWKDQIGGLESVDKKQDIREKRKFTLYDIMKDQWKEMEVDAVRN